jgi:hypothetical protein
MGAIYIDPTIKRAKVNLQECVEYYACYTGLSQEHLNPTIVRTTRKIFQMLRLRFDPEPDVCPTAAFEPEELTWPRVVRRAFSDPRVPHESTGVEGRGTEEVKTNDISGRVKSGRPATIELAGPASASGCARFSSCAGRSLTRGRVREAEPDHLLMTDVATGTLREDILNEKLMSAIVEIKVPVERVEEIVRLVWDVEKRVDTVVALGVGTRCDEKGEDNVVAPVLERLGYSLERAKTNVGLGRITNQAAVQSALEMAKS